MKNSKNRASRNARSGKMNARHLMRHIWATQLALKMRTQAVSKHNLLDHERRESPPMRTGHSSYRADGSQQPSTESPSMPADASRQHSRESPPIRTDHSSHRTGDFQQLARPVGDEPRHSDTAEKFAEAIQSASETKSATTPLLAPVTSSTLPFLLPPVNPWKRVHEDLRVMKLGEPGRLALLASTYSSAESRLRLGKPGEPEMTWEEVKAAVRESPPLKRKFNSDVEEDTENPPRPAKMSRFEERTAREIVYDLPKNPFTTYHPTKPRRKRALAMDDEEEPYCQKKRCCDGPVSIFEPRGRSFTGDTISQIVFDAAKSNESPHQEPKKAKGSVPLNCQMPSVVPKPEVENSLRPAQADVASNKISVPNIEETTPPSIPKVRLQAAERPAPKPTVTNATEPSKSPPSSTAPAKNSNKEGDLTRLFFKSTQNSRDRALGYLRFARNRAIISQDPRLVSKMTESQRLSLELDLIKPTGTRSRPSSSLHTNEDDNDSSINNKFDN